HRRAGAPLGQRADHLDVGRHVETEAAVGSRHGGRDDVLGVQITPALDRIGGLPVVAGRPRGQALARQPRRRLDDAGRGGAHAIRPPAAERRDVTHRQVSIWCSSIMLSNGSFMKICCDCGPTTLSATQYSTPSRSSSLRVSWMLATASATCGVDGSLPGHLANFDCPFTPMRWIWAVPP